MPNVNQIHEDTTTEDVIRFFEETFENNSHEEVTAEDVLRSFAETSIDLDRDLNRYISEYEDW